MHNDYESPAAKKPEKLPSGMAAAERESEYFDRFVAKEGDFNPLAQGLENPVSPFRGDGAPDGKIWRWPRCRLRHGPLSGQISAGKTAPFCRHGSVFRGPPRGSGQVPRGHLVARRRLPDSVRRPRSFHVVCFSAVLHHIAEFPQAVREGFRVLRPGGYVFAFDPEPFSSGHGAFPASAFSWLTRPKASAPMNARSCRPSWRAAFHVAGLVEHPATMSGRHTLSQSRTALA